MSAAETTLGLDYLQMKKVVTDRLVTKKCPGRDSGWQEQLFLPAKHVKG